MKNKVGAVCNPRWGNKCKSLFFMLWQTYFDQEEKRQNQCWGRQPPGICDVHSLHKVKQAEEKSTQSRVTTDWIRKSQIH